MKWRGGSDESCGPGQDIAKAFDALEREHDLRQWVNMWNNGGNQQDTSIMIVVDENEPVGGK